MATRKPPERLPIKVSRMAVDRIIAGLRPAPVAFTMPEIPKGVVPAKFKGAMDQACNSVLNYANLGFSSNLGLDGQAWLGFPALAMLSQRAEYRSMTETLSKEMTRKFVKLTSTGGDADPKKLKILEAEVKRFKCRQVMRKALEHDGFFGRGSIHIRTEGAGKDNQPLVLDAKTFKKGALKGFNNIEPMWIYPGDYNSLNPLLPNWYMPTYWWVQGEHVDSSRLLTITTRPVSDILKPAYAFAGLSLTQLAMEYVNNWVRTRNSTGDIVHSFSLTILKTNMGATLSGSCDDDLVNRMILFNKMRDNRGAFVADKDSEEIEQINTPLAGLADLQAQAQEQLASVSHLPLVKLLGTTPKGLNATAEPELKSFYDFIASEQEDNCSEPFQIMLEAIQLNKFGEVDPDITFEWEPLWQMDDEAQSRIRKSNADADLIYQTMGAVSTEEVRAKVAADPTSGYSGLDLTEMPEPPEDDTDDDGEDEPPKSKPAEDAAFNESDHPRDASGKFGTGSGESGHPNSPHERPTASYTHKGVQSLKTLGVKPAKRADPTLTGAARVAWHVAITTKKPVAAHPTSRGWAIMTPGTKVPPGTQHIVVTPEGEVHQYAPKGFEEWPK